MVRINTIIFSSRLWKGFSLPFALFFLVVYSMQYFNMEAYKATSKIVGLLPKIIEKVIPCTFEFQGETLSYSFVIIAAFIFLTFFFASSQESKFLALKREKEQKAYLEREKKEQFIREYLLKKQSKNNAQDIVDNGFCGLFELKFEYLNVVNKSQDELLRLKKEYSKLIFKKMKENYPDVKFAASENLFFFSKTKEIFNFFLLDLMQLYGILKELDNKKFIKTDFLLSFASEDEVKNTKYLYKLLKKMNEMNNANKAVAFEKFQKSYAVLPEKRFDYVSLGVLQIDVDDNVNYSGEFGYYIGY